jgi:uncharacterized protein (DUF433 family)
VKLLDRITIDPDICHGRPTLRGLRYPVEMVLDLLSSGMTPEEILDDYEDLERDDIFAALAYAARIARVKRIETTDREINEVSIRESRVVATKDSDFVDSLLLHRQPFKLLLVTTGNIKDSR